MKKIIDFYNTIFFSYLHFAKIKFNDSEPNHVSAYLVVVISASLNILFFFQIIELSVGRSLVNGKSFFNSFFMLCLIIAALFYFQFLHKKRYNRKYKISKSSFLGIGGNKFMWFYFSFSFILPILTSVIQYFILLMPYS